jgi:hypothetical protein
MFDFLTGKMGNFFNPSRRGGYDWDVATASRGDINPEALEDPIAMADRYFKDSLWEMSNAFLQRQKAEEKRIPPTRKVGYSGIKPVSIDKMGFMNIPPMVDPGNLGGGR